MGADVHPLAVGLRLTHVRSGRDALLLVVARFRIMDVSSVAILRSCSLDPTTSCLVNHLFRHPSAVAPLQYGFLPRLIISDAKEPLSTVKDNQTSVLPGMRCLMEVTD